MISRQPLIAHQTPIPVGLMVWECLIFIMGFWASCRGQLQRAYLTYHSPSWDGWSWQRMQGCSHFPECKHEPIASGHTHTEHTQNTKHSPYIHKTATGGQSQSRPGWLVIREVGSLGRWSHHGLISTVWHCVLHSAESVQGMHNAFGMGVCLLNG